MSTKDIERVLRQGAALCREAERFMRHADAALYLFAEKGSIPDHLQQVLSEDFGCLRSDVYYFRKHASHIDPAAADAEIARLSAALAETRAQLEEERERSAGLVNAAVRAIESIDWPVGNSAAGELAAEWTGEKLREARDAVRALAPPLAIIPGDTHG